MHRRTNVRSGITLTEILIAIMIMGIGFVSLATLFPIGLMRMRDATRASRSTLLAESAVSEVHARNLLYGPTFVAPAPGWYAAYNLITGNTIGGGGNTITDPSWPFFRDRYAPSPWTKDLFGTPATDRTTPGVYAGAVGPGLPVAYDPLFWSTVHYDTFSDATSVRPDSFEGLGIQARFGSGVGLIRGGNPAADGLQRITNFLPYDPTLAWQLTYSLPNSVGIPGTSEQAGDALGSLDDIVFEEDGADSEDSSPLVPFDFNPLAPDPTTGALNYETQRNWDFTWMLTARQAAAGNSSVYEADIVVFHKRPFGFETNTASGIEVPLGERVVEAVWGHTGTPGAISPAGNGYSTADDRSVLLRWPATQPDPRVRVGDWIADVTYERLQSASVANFPAGSYPGQRCHWYRIVQAGEIEIDPVVPGHRRLVVRVGTPVKAKTRLVTDGTVVDSAVPEAALINPYVVNVHSTLLYSRQ